MKQVILVMMALLAACLGSCGPDATQESGEEIPVPESGTPIVFNAQQDEQQTVTRSEAATGGAAATRADTPLSEKTSTMTVWGYKNMDYADGTGYGGLQQVFSGYTAKYTENSAATTTTNTHGWEYVNQQPIGGQMQTIKYWDWSARAYRFFAAAAGNATDAALTHLDRVSFDESTRQMIISVDASTDEHVANTPYYSRLWFSTGNTDDYPGKAFGAPVRLEFVKPVTRVRFIFTFEDPADKATTELTNKSFGPTNGSTVAIGGDLIVSYPLTGTGTQETISIDGNSVSGLDEGVMKQDYYETVTIDAGTGKPIAPYANANPATTGYWYTVLPRPGQGTYTLSVNVDGLEQSCVVPAEYMNWLPGYSYTYVFKVHVEARGVSIDTVQSAFTEWEEETGTHNIYNW